MKGVKQEKNGLDAADPNLPSTWSRPPSWLHLPPDGQDVPPPIETQCHSLPVEHLAWGNFERLCLRLLENELEPIHTSFLSFDGEATSQVTGLYGQRGEKQYGIDVYARDRLPLGQPAPVRRYVTLQARRTKSVQPAKLRKTVEDFLGGIWAGVSRRYVYATSGTATSTSVVNEIERLAPILSQNAIEFEVWDKEKISRILKENPRVVDEYFGRQWVAKFCGDDAALGLGSRLDAGEVTRLRRELAGIYTASFGVADSGLIPFRFREANSVGLRQRFVQPDLIPTTPYSTSFNQFTNRANELNTDTNDLQTILEEAEAWNTLLPDKSDQFLRKSLTNRPKVESHQTLERRPAEELISNDLLQVIVGDPGAGKSTVLRYLVLDLLSEEPMWRDVAERWGQRLPVWLPFHFFTQRVDGTTGGSASVGQSVKAWLEQHDAGHVWPLVDKALRDQRLLLIVDGLDEWVNDDAGAYAIAALQTFAAARSVPLIASTRPYGLERLRLGPTWSYNQIAPLTPEQQRLLAIHYFRAVLHDPESPSSQNVIERTVDDFFAQVHDTAALRELAGTPLFLILLVGLSLSSIANLPSERFAVYDEAVKLLVADHPESRRVAAAVTTRRHKLTDRQLRAVLARVAYECQVRGDFTTLHEPQVRRDFICALSNPDRLAFTATNAADTADRLLDTTEGEIGLLVRQGPSELSFLHRLLQEQLAAEYIANNLLPSEVNDMFVKRVGDPQWHEVLLGTIWRLSRPSELREVTDAILACIDESPSGLRAREILAEVIFGPYDVPADVIHKAAPDIIATIETHPLIPHRVRLLNAVIDGLGGAATESIAMECLDRWTILAKEPTADLVTQIALLPHLDESWEAICTLLLRGLHNTKSDVAYSSAVAIAGRCSIDAPGNEDERTFFRTRLLALLSAPQSALAQAAALLALALEWRDDPFVDELLRDARCHSEAGVRIVALADALGVLHSTFSEDSLPRVRRYKELNSGERDWLAKHIWNSGRPDVHRGLLFATVTESIRDQPAVLEELVENLIDDSAPFHVFDMVWPVGLNVLADDERVAKIVCEKLRSKENSKLSVLISMGNGRLLEQAYPPESPYNELVANAIEERIRTSNTQGLERQLFGLASVDRGPVMKKTLMEHLAISAVPHWAAESLASYFGDDCDVRDALRSMMMGDSIRASKIANVATRVLSTSEVIPRLLDILRDLSSTKEKKQGRYDIVASALIQAYNDRQSGRDLATEEIAAEALKLMPDAHDPLLGDPRYDLAITFYPSTASKEMLAELAGSVDYTLEPFLHVFRHESELLEPFIADASKIMHSLPAYLRSRVCQALADRTTAPEVVMHLTRRWADEVSNPNKSIASLAYYRALLKIREREDIDNERWNQEMAELGNQATSYGFDHQARRRAAWVGMCVCEDWSVIRERLETVGDAKPVDVEVDEPLYGPDITLLQQLASQWDRLRLEFGDTLFTRFSRWSMNRSTSDLWGTFALVADQSHTLHQELEAAIAEDNELLRLDGVLIWFVSRGIGTSDAIADALVSHLWKNFDHRNSVATTLIAESERIGLQTDELQRKLEGTLRGFAPDVGDPSLEALAMLDPDNPAVSAAWQQLSYWISTRRSRADHPLHAPTYFAVSYAAAKSSNILKLIENGLDLLDEISEPYLDRVFVRNVIQRLRRDTIATNALKDLVVNPATTDSRAAQLISTLKEGVGLDERLLREAERRIANQNTVKLAIMARDPAVSATFPVRTIFTRAVNAD